MCVVLHVNCNFELVDLDLTYFLVEDTEKKLITDPVPGSLVTISSKSGRAIKVTYFPLNAPNFFINLDGKSYGTWVNGIRPT